MAVTQVDLSYPKTPCYMQTSWLYVLQNCELFPMELLHCGKKDFLSLLHLWPWPWPDDLHIWTWPVLLEIYQMCIYELPMLRFLKVIVWQVDTTEMIYCAASRVAKYKVRTWQLRATCSELHQNCGGTSQPLKTWSSSVELTAVSNKATTTTATEELIITELNLNMVRTAGQCCCYRQNKSVYLKLLYVQFLLVIIQYYVLAQASIIPILM